MILFFALIAFIMVASAVAVVLFRNPLQSALALILHMICVAAVYAQLDAHFLAAVQIVVYAGAIMVLVLFLVMLLNIKVEKLRPIGRVYMALGVLAGAGFLVILVPVLQKVFTMVPDPIAPLEGTAKAVGRILYTEYLFPFEIASVLIFVAIVGAVMVAKRNYTVVGTSSGEVPESAKEASR